MHISLAAALKAKTQARLETGFFEGLEGEDAKLSPELIDAIRGEARSQDD